MCYMRRTMMICILRHARVAPPQARHNMGHQRLGGGYHHALSITTQNSRSGPISMTVCQAVPMAQGGAEGVQPDLGQRGGRRVPEDRQLPRLVALRPRHPIPGARRPAWLRLVRREPLRKARKRSDHSHAAWRTSCLDMLTRCCGASALIGPCTWSQSARYDT